jgi:hypothetical protein
MRLGYISGKCVNLKRVSWVRIPLSPLKTRDTQDLQDEK